MDIDDVKAYVQSYVERISCQIAEHQDKMIMCVVEQIGGAEYRKITVDRRKVTEALTKATARRPLITGGYRYADCPSCHRNLRTNQKYCDGCGQKLNWKEDVTE